MGYAFYFPDLLDIHIREDILKQITPDRRVVLENLLLGQNIRELCLINDVASAVVAIPEDKVRTITREEIISEFLHGEDFLEHTGQLV